MYSLRPNLHFLIVDSRVALLLGCGKHRASTGHLIGFRDGADVTSAANTVSAIRESAIAHHSIFNLTSTQLSNDLATMSSSCSAKNSTASGMRRIVSASDTGVPALDSTRCPVQ
jgi:hypothetical protein